MQLYLCPHFNPRMLKFPNENWMIFFTPVLDSVNDVSLPACRLSALPLSTQNKKKKRRRALSKAWLAVAAHSVCLIRTFRPSCELLLDSFLQPLETARERE